MNLFWQQNKIIIVFFTLLTGLTVFSYVDNAEEEKVSVPLTQILEEPVDLKKLPIESREPASIGVVDAKMKSPNKIALEIFCESSAKKINSTNHLVMLEMTTCHELKERYQLWVKNETNGFKAQIFKTAENKFKTDFLQLSKGSNKVIFEGVLKNGQKVVQTLEIQSGS